MNTQAASVTRLLKGRILRGCNIYYSNTVFRQRVDLGWLAFRHSRDFGATFPARFTERFMGLKTFARGGHMTDTFLDRLYSDTGVQMEEALFEAILAVELSLAHTMGRLAPIEYVTIFRPAPRQVDFVWESNTPQLSGEAASVALLGFLELCHALPDPPDIDTFTDRFATLQKRARRRQWSAKVAFLAVAAKRRRVPFESLGDEYLLLGQGVAQQVICAGNKTNPFVNEPREGVRSENDDNISSFIKDVPGRVPVALIAGQRGTTQVVRALEWMLRSSGKAVGMATAKGTTIRGEPVDTGSMGQRDGARFLLQDPRVEVLVTATSPRRIESRGLRFDACTIAAIMGPLPPGQGKRERRGIEVVVRATYGPLVVDAEHASSIRGLQKVNPERLILVSSRRHDITTQRHLAEGGTVVRRAFHGDAEYLEVQSGSEVALAIPVSSTAQAENRQPERRITERMFAIALAIGLNLDPGQIEMAVRHHACLPG